MKKKRIIIVIIILVIVLGLLLGIKMIKKDSKSSSLKEKVENTVISEDTTGYKLDLRIYGTYEKRNINEIVMVTNYKNTDKDIRITSIKGSSTNEKEYMVKGNKYYEVEEGKLTEVSKVPYSNTDIYLEGVKKISEVTEKGKEIIGEKEYTVYTGKVSKEVMNKMLEATETNTKVKTDAECEVWLTSDNHVYKVYYKADDITLYPSYFGYNKATTIDLSVYKK